MSGTSNNARRAAAEIVGIGAQSSMSFSMRLATPMAYFMPQRRLPLREPLLPLIQPRCRRQPHGRHHDGEHEPAKASSPAWALSRASARTSPR